MYSIKRIILKFRTKLCKMQVWYNDCFHVVKSSTCIWYQNTFKTYLELQSHIYVCRELVSKSIRSLFACVLSVMQIQIVKDKIKTIIYLVNRSYHMIVIDICLPFCHRHFNRSSTTTNQWNINIVVSNKWWKVLKEQTFLWNKVLFFAFLKFLIILLVC